MASSSSRLTDEQVRKEVEEALDIIIRESHDSTSFTFATQFILNEDRGKYIKTGADEIIDTSIAMGMGMLVPIRIPANALRAMTTINNLYCDAHYKQVVLNALNSVTSRLSTVPFTELKKETEANKDSEEAFEKAFEEFSSNLKKDIKYYTATTSLSGSGWGMLPLTSSKIPAGPDKSGKPTIKTVPPKVKKLWDAREESGKSPREKADKIFKILNEINFKDRKFRSQGTLTFYWQNFEALKALYKKFNLEEPITVDEKKVASPHSTATTASTSKPKATLSSSAQAKALLAAHQADSLPNAAPVTETKQPITGAQPPTSGSSAGPATPVAVSSTRSETTTTAPRSPREGLELTSIAPEHKSLEIKLAYDDLEILAKHIVENVTGGTPSQQKKSLDTTPVKDLIEYADTLRIFTTDPALARQRDNIMQYCNKQDLSKSYNSLFPKLAASPSTTTAATHGMRSGRP